MAVVVVVVVMAVVALAIVPELVVVMVTPAVLLPKLDGRDQSGTHQPGTTARRTSPPVAAVGVPVRGGQTHRAPHPARQRTAPRQRLHKQQGRRMWGPLSSVSGGTCAGRLPTPIPVLASLRVRPTRCGTPRVSRCVCGRWGLPGRTPTPPTDGCRRVHWVSVRTHKLQVSLRRVHPLAQKRGLAVAVAAAVCSAPPPLRSARLTRRAPTSRWSPGRHRGEC